MTTKREKINKHIWLSIGCPIGKHANFRFGENRFICEHCGKEFTREVKKVYEALKVILGLNK